MIIKLACECGSTFTITEKIISSPAGYITCPNCGYELSSSAYGSLRAMYRNYTTLCEELNRSQISVKSLKLAKKQETSKE